MTAAPEGRTGPAIELALVLALAWVLLGSIAFVRGEMGISWDALNHHIYLGWTAQSPRFDRDVLAASYQTYQFPYLYWPVYRLAIDGFSGQQAAFILATLHLIAVPPVWMMARMTIPGGGWFPVGLRIASTVLAFMSGLILSLFDSTSNDLLAATPVLWALTIAMRPVVLPRSENSMGSTVLSGVLGGVATACKLSNAPMVLLLAPLWALMPGTALQRWTRLALGGVAVFAGFTLTYGYWGWQLWSHFGNPFFPFLEGQFAHVRAVVGWQP